MIINPKIRELLSEISKESIKHANTYSVNRRYLQRLISIYIRKLDAKEQEYLLAVLLRELSHKRESLDPDTLILQNNLKIKHVLYCAGSAIAIIFSIAIAYSVVTDNTSTIGEIFKHILELF